MTDPTPEEMVTAVRAAMIQCEKDIDDGRHNAAHARLVVKNARARIAELKRMLPRKPRAKKSK